MKTKQSDKQLSGVGFSSTQPNRLLCKVSGKFDRIMEITFAPNHSERFKEPEVEPIEIQKVGKCEICKASVYNTDSRLTCPHCDGIFHTSHFLEWVRVGGNCPICKQRVSQYQIDEIVQLVTVT